MPSDKTQKNLSGLHNTLETMGYSVPNIDQFAKDMRKEENLRSVYDKVSSGGYELPDFDTFKADMGWIKPTPAGVPTPLRPKDQLAPTGKPDAPATPFGFDLHANPKKPSHAPKARLGFPRLDKKMRPVQEVNDPSVPLLKTTRDVAQDENGNVVNVVQPELVPDFDPNNGGVAAPKALMDVTTGKTIRPAELSKEEVDGYNAGNIDAIKDPKLRQALKEANIIYAPTLTESDARRKAGELTSEIDKALAERTEYLDKKMGEVTIADSPTAWGIRGFNIPAAANKSRIEQANDSEYMTLEAARRTMQDVNNLIAEADHNTKKGGDLASVYERSALAGTLRGFGTTIINPKLWDQGARDFSDEARLSRAVDKADRGEQLTRGEQLLLDAKANEMATALYFEDRIGRGYKAGSVTAHAIPFMVEMAMSGGISTMGKNVSSGLARYAMRRFGAKAAGKAIIKRTIRGAATTAGAMLAGGAMANTFGAMKTAANVVGRTTGDVQFATGVDAEGRAMTTYGGHTEGDSLGEAFVKGELSSTAEYATELLGDGLVDAVKWAAGKVASPIAAKITKLIGKTGAEAAEQVGKKSVLGKVAGSVGDAGVWTLSKASKFIGNMQASKFATSLKALEKQAQWNGVFGEYLEEKANDIAAVMIGDKDLSTDKGKGFFNLDDNIDTFLGVSLMGGVMSGAQTVGYFAGGGARGMARYQIGQSEGAVWSTLTTDEQRKAWDDVRRQILLQDGKEQVDAVKSALTNPNFNAEQRRAILDYTKSVQTYKGMSEYRRKQSEDTKADPLQNELADSYDKGAGMTEAEEMSHARSWYEFTQQKAAERLGVDAEALDEMGAPDQLTLDQVAQLREEHNEQAVQSYVDYLNARATYEGMIGSVSQGIQAEAAQAEQAVRSQQHKDGTLRRATLRGTEGQNVEVHIKDGDLVMDEEGRIDTDKSSKDFIVRDNETGVVRFASIDDIISAEQPTSADDAVNEAVNAVYERREKEAADAINGTITPQVGAVYNLLDADGNPQQIAIRQIGQDGTLDVDYSGVPHKMTTEELQTMADNTRARQIENEHAAQVQQAKAEEREEREQAGLPRYALNDELTIRTPEGEEVTAYVTNEEDADGNIEVYFNEPFDGKKVHLFTKDYLDGVVVGTRLSPETNASAGAVEAPATPAAPALAQAQPVSEEVPEEATTAPTPTQEEENDIIGRSMTEEEAEAFLTAISNNHEVAPELELTPENWYAEFGEDGMVHTPIGDAHMGENQFLKMMRDGRKSKLGMIRPTLEAPHAIVEEPSTAKEGQETERDSSYIYIRVFEKEDGSRHYHFTSVSVQRDGGEVIVSNQEKSRNQVKRLLTEGVVLWMRADNAPDTSDVDQDLYSSQGTELSDPASEGTDASQSTPSESKGNESTSHDDPNDESLSPEEAYEAVLRATNGDAALALEVIKSTITDKEKALTKAKKAKPRSANTIDGKIQALAEVASGIEAAEASLAHWQAVAEIAAEQVQEEAGVVAEPVAEQTEQEAEEPTTEPAPSEEEVTEEQEPEEEVRLQRNELTLIDVVRTLSEKGKTEAAKIFQRRYFDVANTSELLKGLGLTGDKFTIRYGVIARHFGKDNQHDLPVEVWEKLPEALSHPLVVTKYYIEKGKQKGYRIFTPIQLNDGSFVVVSAEVKNAGKAIEVNSINTLFGKNKVSETHDEVIYESKEMTPEQRTLLDGTNPRQYSDTQESLSTNKDSEKTTHESTPKKEESKPLPKPQKVSLEGLMGELYATGEARLSDHIEKEEVAPEAGDTQASEATGEGYRLSAIAAKQGGNFFENSEGSIDLVKISDNVFEAIGIKPLPMRMTEAMAQHIIKQHAKELGISTQEEAVAFVVDIMQNFDHVREGNKPNTYIFSIENGRSRTGKRAVTLVLPSKSGEYLGVSSSGYEKVSRLKERALLWEEGANNEAPTTETASVNVTSPSATQGGMTGGSASNQSNALSQGKDSEKNTAEGGANDDNQDDLSIEEKEALLSKAKQDLVEKEAERTAVAEQAIALMKDYYDSGAISGMDSGEFHGQATLILIGFKDRSNLELMKAPGLSELLPSLYKLADEARAKKVLVRKYEKELSQAKEVEGETLTHDKDIRDELVNTMRDAGIEVVTDEAEGQAVLDAARAGDAQMQRAYHGTDADFEAFDHSHMGEGAGGQAYGWGSYFTEEEGVARSYAGGGFVYEAELPDDTGSNYLYFESKPSYKDIARVKRELVEYILRNDEEGMYDYPQGKDDLTQEVDDAGEPTTWRDLYGTVSSHLGSDKEASAFFHSIGYVGIRYNSSESEGGKTNFVIFDESDISIQSKVRLFKSPSGEVYGFVKDGKIYLDLKHATAETAIHEYTHLWSSALRRVNPRAWKSIRKQLKGFELWADIASRYPELKGDEDALADEVLAQYSGKRGAQRIEEEMKKAENATDLVGKARVLAAFNSLKEALKTFWTEVADFFGMDYYKSVEDAADKAMSDLLRGVNPNAVEAKKKPTKNPTAKKETATSSVIAPDSDRYNGYIVTLPKKGKAGAEVGNIEEFVAADGMREGLTVIYQAPEGFAVASNGTMAIADKTQFDVYKKGKAYKLDGTTIDAGAWKPLKDKWQSFISTETRGEHYDPFTESPVNITRLSKYLDRVEQDLYNRWKYAKSEGLTKDSFKTYRSQAMVSIPNGRGWYVEYRYPEMRSMTLAAKRLGVTSFFVEGDHHYESSVYPGVRLVGNGRLGSVVHAGYIFRHDAPNPSESELSYLYDEAVGVKDTDEGVRMQKGDEGLSLQETSDAINARFNEELKEQIEGTLPKGHIYSLGMPSKALRSAGVPNLPIELTARRLATKASQEYHSEHPFELSDIQNLPKAIAHPIAVFDSSTRSDSTVVLTELQDSRGVNFVVALRVVRSSVSRSLEIDVNGIRSIYPKDRVTSILKWITSGKMLWVDKKKALSWITIQLSNAGYDSNATESPQDSEGRLDKQRSNSADVTEPKLQASDGEANKQRSNSAEVASHPQEDGLSKTKIAQQRTNLADVDYLDLDNVTKVVETFDNPRLVSEDLEIGNDNQASEDNDEEVRYRSDELDEVSNRFNAELAQLTEENSDSTIFSLGMPSSELIAGGVSPKLMRLYGNKVIKKMKKHGFALSDLLDLPKAVAHPIAVFSTHRDGSHAILTELKTEEGNILVTLEVGKGGADIDFNLLTSTYGKSHGKVVQWLNSGKATYINKEKALEYLASAPAPIAGAKQAQELSLATKVVETFENPELSEESNAIVQMEEVATRTAEALGEDVRVIHDTAEIEGRNERETSRMRGAKGWYDPKTGQVVVVLPNAESADDVEATILHEVVGHKGLQELVGKDQFGKFLDEVFEGANEAVRNGIVERSKRYGWNTRLATEEYIAELAEQGFKDLEARDLWNVVRNAFYNLLSRVKLALGWDISDRELRYMLWRTYQMKKGEGLMGQAKDIAMQEKLGVGNYEEARFRQGESAAPVNVAATYDALIKKSSYQTQEALQDSMLSLKKVMEMIMQAKGDAKYIEEIEGYQNAYMGENRVSSVNQAEAAAYSRMALEPLVEEVSRLAKKAHHSYVTDYMMAKHGLERNRVMAFQKAVEADVDAHNKAVKESGEGEELTASSLWDAYLNDTDRLRNEADYREGRITADVWHKTDDEIRARYAPNYAEYRERDYAGLTGLLDRPDVDIQTLEEEAIEEVMKFEQENDVTDLWDLTNKATDAPLSKQYEGGLMSRETLEHVRNMYGYYIPLRGFDETTSDEAYSYLGDRDRAFSPTLKKAKGRSSKAEDPLAHIASMMESAILQSNRNKLVRQKFLNFVENNPSDLFSVQKLWVQWNNTTKTWDAVLPEFDPSDTSEEVIRKTQEFEEAMRKSQRENPELFKLASEQPSIPYRVVGQDKKMQHQIIVKRGGRDVVIIVNGDPRVAMAVNGLTNPDGNVGGDIGPIFKAGAALNRKLAGYYTSLSPNFVVKNFIRDIIYANTIVWVKESPSYALRYHKNVGKLALQMHRLVHLYEHDKLDMSNETHRAFKLFMENGGETGYSQLRSMDRHKKEIERMMKESGGRISLKQGFRLLGETMEFANRGIEDLSRFAAFLTSRQMGRTIDRSIYDAKEMTVNFNKKGAGSTFHDAHTQTGKGKAAAYLSGTGRSLYLFWNVSIQGSVNIVRAVKRNPKKGAAYLATFLALGILQTVLPALTGGDDDDRYWNLPDYVRRNNICFFVGDVLVKIPLPQEARAIFGIGELGMSYMSGKEDKDAWMVAYTIAGQLSQIMPLDLMDDSGPIHALMPSIFKPALEAYTNHSWMGRPIWKDTDYNKAMPNWTKAYKSTGGVYVWLAKELNALSGGDDYKKGLININPARLEYLLKGYFGGLYTAADQIIKSSETAFGDREFSMRDVPILSGFLDGADERNDMRNVNNTYYHFKEEAKEVLRLGKSYERDAEQGKGDYAKKLDELVNNKSYERALLFDDLSKEIEEMQKALKEATDPKEAEELQAEIDKQKKALVIQLRQMK